MVPNGKEQKEKIGWGGGGGKKAWVDKENNTTASHLKKRIKREAGKEKKCYSKYVQAIITIMEKTHTYLRASLAASCLSFNRRQYCQLLLQMLWLPNTGGCPGIE